MENRRARDLQFEVLGSGRLTPTQRQDVVSLCSQAYDEDFAPYLSMLAPAVHLLGSVDGRLVTHAAWVTRELRSATAGPMRTAYVEAVATLPGYQCRGYASALLSLIPPFVADLDIAALSPSNEVFYARLGWEPWRGPLSYRDPNGREIDTPDEAVMIYRLPRTPPDLDVTASLSTDWRAIEVW